MTKEQAINRLCNLTSKVMQMEFNNQEPADCFCQCANLPHQHTSEKIIRFIEEAVGEKLNSNAQKLSEIEY